MHKALVSQLSRFGTLALLALSLTLNYCVPPKKVIRKGVVMTENEAARLDYDEAEKLYKANKLTDALTSYELFVKSYATHKLSADALYKTSRIHLRQKNEEKAIASLEKLIFKFPLSDLINVARYDLGRLYLKRKMYPEARDVLAAVELSPFPPKKRVKILKSLRKALKFTEDWKTLADCDLKIYDISSEFAEISKLKNEVFNLIEFKLTEAELTELADARKGSYPADLALWKLSKTAYHTQNFKNARSYLVSLLKNYPLSEYYTEAEILYDKLIRKRTPDTYSIGLLLPLSGPNSVIGEFALKGVWLASDLFNREKGLYDNFKIIVRDTQGNPDVASRAFDELVLEKRVIGIIGPMLNKPSEVAALKAQEYGVPVILLNQKESIVEIGDYVFRNFISKEEQATTLAKFSVETLGIKRFAFLYPLHNYGRSFVNSFWDELERYPDVEVKGAEAYKPDTNDFSKPIKKLVGLFDLKYRKPEICTDKKSKRPKSSYPAEQEKTCYEVEELPPIIDFEALVVPDNYEKIIQIAPALLYHNVKGIQLVGGNLWNSENLFKENTARYLQGAILTDVFYKKSSKEITKDFTKRFTKTFGHEPDIIGSHAFEGASVMLQAIRSTRPSSHSGLKHTLLNKKDFRTISGVTAFSGNRNLKHDLSILIIDGNEIKELY